MDFPEHNSEFDAEETAIDRDPAESRTARSQSQRSGGRGGSGRGGSDGGPRQQMLMRRAIALGVGLLVLILLVLGAKGCLDARKNRSLEDYASNVTQIVDETNSLSESFFGRLDDPQGLSVPDFVSEIESDRSAMDGFLSRVDKLDTPGDMEGAQRTLTLVYQLRSGAMNTIADRMSTATGDAGRDKAIKTIAAQISILSAADVLYNQVTRHQIDDAIEGNGATAPAMPKSAFVPDVAKWVDPTEVDTALSRVTGGAGSAPTDGGVRGTGLQTVSIGGIPLESGTVIAAGTEPAVIVSVMNQGESDEDAIEVTVSVDGGDPIRGSIDTLAPGETGDASILLTPAPKGAVKLDVSVTGVPGEQLLDNNEISYAVTFE
jgi:hypothetical protein